MLKLSARVFCILLPAMTAHADSTEPFQSLYPEFLKTEITPAYWQHESPMSPATYEADHGDFLSDFLSPSGKQVRVVVKAPVTTTEYDVPPIGNGQTAYDYLNSALYDANLHFASLHLASRFWGAEWRIVEYSIPRRVWIAVASNTHGRAALQVRAPSCSDAAAVRSLQFVRRVWQGTRESLGPPDEPIPVRRTNECPCQKPSGERAPD
jgi:hypothetical protein